MSKETTVKKSEGDKSKKFALGKQNYILMGVGIVVVIVGFLLMSGGGSEDPAEWSEELFSSRRITLAPFMVIIGYVIVIFAIMRKPKG